MYRSLRSIGCLLVFAVGLPSCIIVTDDEGDGSPNRGEDPITEGTIKFNNISNYTIEDVRISEVSDANWSSNLLSTVGSLLPDETLIVDVDCGTYDVQVSDEAGAVCELGAIDLCGTVAEWDITNKLLDSCSFRESKIQISNASSYALVGIFVASASDTSYGPNILADVPNGVLLPGEDLSVILGCDVYDIRVEDEDGVMCELDGVNLCDGDQATWVVTDPLLDECAFTSTRIPNQSETPGDPDLSPPAKGAAPPVKI